VIGAIAWFEFRTKLRRISTYVYMLVFTALAALWMAAAAGAFASASIVFSSDKVFVNAPYALAQTVTVLGLFGVVIIAAFMGRAVQQDFEHGSFHFFFTSPISKAQYLLGRYLGAVVTLLFIFLGIALGIWIGAHWPGADKTRLGPWSLASLAQPYLVMLLPNILVLGGIYFMLAALTRRMLPVYIAGVVTLIGYTAALGLMRDIDNKTLASLIDPLGSRAMINATRYWSPAEKNTNMIPLAGEVLWNRALWLAIGAVIFGVGYARFRFAFAAPEGRRTKKGADDPQPVEPRARRLAVPAVSLDTRTVAYLRQLPGLVRLYLRETVKNVYFIALALAGALFIFFNATTIGSLYGTKTYPVTYQVIDIAGGSFALFALIITAFYAGELVWRERDARLAQIADSLPQPTWLPFLAKLFTLMGVQVVLQVIVMACGILVQLFSGYTKLELGQYFFTLFVLQLPTYWMVAALALMIHSLVNHKYLGHFLVILYYVVEISSDAFGYDLRLYHFGNLPTVVYSDMNRYGHFLGPLFWFMAYWGAASVLMLVVARLAWVRGTDTGKARWRIARASLTPPVLATAAVAGVAFVALGGWIGYNIMVLNPYRSEFAREELQAEYERRYKSYDDKPQPKVVASHVDVDIFPYRHHVRFRGTYKLRNKTQSPIAELYVGLLETAKINKLEAAIPMKVAEERRDLGWLRYALERPLAPGESTTFTYDLEYPPEGFTNSGARATVVDNGTFLNSGLLPQFGYQDRAELQRDLERKKHGLPPKAHLMPDLDDKVNQQRNYISSDGDWIDFDAVVSTAPDQIALAPGYLQREWTENGRRYFHYKMDVPILHFYSFLSARWAVKRGQWRGGDAVVPIEIYYQPGHEYNVDTMIAGVKDSLDYFTRAFSPYQHRQVRILEFPRYASFAQSFPNTIPFSESIGFIAKVKPDDPKDIDYPYYVTAHEVAHQWWAHQVIGAYVQGATLMSETLAQYSALMVMKKKYGDAKMKRFLKYELDFYLTGRGIERKQEQPLYRNENQAYIHYRKGSLAMYALQDYIGEDNVNKALASYIKKVAYKGPPYTTSRDLLAEFRAVTPPEYQYLIEDLFETITIYENRAISATYAEKDGKFEVKLKVSAKKSRAKDQGSLDEVKMDDLVDIGVMGADDKPLYLQKRRVKSGESEFTVVVDEKPVRAGIDPVVKLVDRRPDDNTIPVTKE
jgi:ABC-type transport system involved in multi-copper enzyme maturation permease subunit